MFLPRRYHIQMDEHQGADEESTAIEPEVVARWLEASRLTLEVVMITLKCCR